MLLLFFPLRAALQAAYRGHQGRTVYRRLLAEQQEQLRRQQEREAAALAVIAPWARAFSDRVWFLRAQRAAPVLQAWWRREFARRQAAAVTIQAAVRCFLAQRQMQRSRRAALVLQVGCDVACVQLFCRSRAECTPRGLELDMHLLDPTTPC